MIARGVIEKKLNKLAKNELNKHLIKLKIGEVQSLKISLKHKNAQINLRLKGEREDIIIKIDGIDCKRESKKWKVSFSQISVSKEWMSILINANLSKINKIINEKFGDFLNKELALGVKVGQVCNLVF